MKKTILRNIMPNGFKEPLIKSSMSRVAGQIAMAARRATKVAAGATMPRSATQQARDLPATRTGTGLAGGLLRWTRCEGGTPFAASSALHPIPQSRVRGHAGLNQRFLNASCRSLALLLLPVAIAGCGDTLTPKPFVFDMTRLNQDGSVNDGKDYAKQPWACVQDNQSGLIWEVKGTESGLHNINNTYSWYDPNQDTNGGFAGKANGGVCAGSDCDTASYINAVNTEKLCGLNDWYLPSRYELNTIVDTSVPFPGPVLAKTFFPESLPGKYWTDTTFKTRRAAAWAWGFDHGSDFVVEKSDGLSVRLTHINPKKPAVKPPKNG